MGRQGWLALNPSLDILNSGVLYHIAISNNRIISASPGIAFLVTARMSSMKKPGSTDPGYLG
jgi:hypothetical protein